MKILIVDDHGVVREGLAALLRQSSDDISVLQAKDGAEALDIAQTHQDLDAVLLDLSMAGLSGMPALVEFGKRHPVLPVIVLSSSEDPEDVRRALASGALGYVPKSASPKTLLSALQLVLQGNVYVPPLMLDEAGSGANKAKTERSPGASPRLTERQIDVLKLLGGGLSNKEIALELGLSEKTVKVHVTGIFKALNVVNRMQAASAARQANLI
jgi:two-component system, NarL family, nitrate/nitrite response regulator NarL